MTHWRVAAVAAALGGVLASGSDAAAAVVPGIAPAVEHRFFGVLQTAQGTMLTLRLRNGRVLTVDASDAFARERVAEPLFAGKATVVEGTFGARNLFHADAVKRTARDPAAWGADR